MRNPEVRRYLLAIFSNHSDTFYYPFLRIIPYVPIENNLHPRCSMLRTTTAPPTLSTPPHSANSRIERTCEYVRRSPRCRNFKRNPYHLSSRMQVQSIHAHRRTPPHLLSQYLQIHSLTLNTPDKSRCCNTPAVWRFALGSTTARNVF
jgi:hypothetical protein